MELQASNMKFLLFFLNDATLGLREAETKVQERFSDYFLMFCFAVWTIIWPDVELESSSCSKKEVQCTDSGLMDKYNININHIVLG